MIFCKFLYGIYLSLTINIFPQRGFLILENDSVVLQRLSYFVTPNILICYTNYCILLHQVITLCYTTVTPNGTVFVTPLVTPFYKKHIYFYAIFPVTPLLHRFYVKKHRKTA